VYQDYVAALQFGRCLAHVYNVHSACGVLIDWCPGTVQEVTREEGRVTALQGRLAPTKAAAETNLKLTWLADVGALAPFPPLRLPASLRLPSPKTLHCGKTRWHCCF
jgi:hypothetical protein